VPGLSGSLREQSSTIDCCEREAKPEDRVEYTQQGRGESITIITK